ncbi:hypothetical protein BGX38DRAFT_1334680 [Terfezia claveryi]|nr:hypothetical protein BGX38DRAFT_1334680 [Terfezia claveryi]
MDTNKLGGNPAQSTGPQDTPTMPQTRSQTLKKASGHQKKVILNSIPSLDYHNVVDIYHTQESDSRETTPALPHYSGTHSSAEHSSTQDEVDLIGIITEFKDYMEKVQLRIGGQPHESRSKKLDTIGLLQLVGHIIKIMQHRVISDLEDEEHRLKAKFLVMRERLSTLGDPGLPSTPSLNTYRLILGSPYASITAMMLTLFPRDVQWTNRLQWTMSNTWDAIWKMLPEDTDGILARIQENIYLEAFKPCDIPDLEIYLRTLIISATVLPIAWDFDHHTINFLGDDKIQQCVAYLQKSMIDNTDTTHTAYDVHCVRAYAIFALRKDPQRFESERAKRVDALARSLHDYLRPLGIIEGLRLEDYLRDAINCAAATGLELAQFKCFAAARRNGCRPGDPFDPRLMTARFIFPGSVKESELVKAGARVALVLSPPFVQMRYDLFGQPRGVETLEGEELSAFTLQKGDVVCYIMKEGRDGGKSVEFPMEEEEVVM